MAHQSTRSRRMTVVILAVSMTVICAPNWNAPAPAMAWGFQTGPPRRPANGWVRIWWSWAHWWAARRFFIDPSDAKPRVLRASTKTTNALLHATEDHDAQVVAAAALALGRMEIKSATPRLIALTKDPRWTVRRTAWMALGLVGSAQAHRRILDVLKHPNLSEKDTEAWIVAVGLLKHPDKSLLLAMGKLLHAKGSVDINRLAAWCLRIHNPPGLVSLMQPILHQVKDPVLVESAILTLGENRSRADERLLGNIFMQTGAATHLPCVARLQYLFVRPFGGGYIQDPTFGSRLEALRCAAAIALGHYPPPTHGVSWSLQYLHMPYKQANVKMQGRHIAQYPFYDRAWRNGDGGADYGGEQRLGLIAMGKIGGSDEADILKQVLEGRYAIADMPEYNARLDPNRGFAALALGIYLNPQRGALFHKAIAPIGKKMQPNRPSGQTARPNHAPVRTIRPQGHEFVREQRRIIRLLHRIALDGSEPAELRGACALALGFSGLRQADAALRDIGSRIQSNQPLLASRVVLAMGLLHDPAALAAERHLLPPNSRALTARAIIDGGLKHPIPIIQLIAQRAAIEGLGRLGDKRAVPVLRGQFGRNIWVSRVVVEALRRCGDKSIEPLLVELLTKAPQPKIRAFAAECLGQLLDANAIPRLDALMQGVDFLAPDNIAPGFEGTVFGGMVNRFRYLVAPFVYQRLFAAVRSVGALGPEWW